MVSYQHARGFEYGECGMTFYTIPPTYSFADKLAQFCDNMAGDQGIPLSTIKIFLPTRRGIRTLQEAFLRLSNGKPRILPIMQSIGDADLEEASFTDQVTADIPPAIAPLRRQIILARMIATAYPDDYTDQQAMGIASDLG